VLSEVFIDVSFVFNEVFIDVSFVFNEVFIDVSFVFNEVFIDVSFVLNEVFIDVSFVFNEVFIDVNFVFNEAFIDDVKSNRLKFKYGRTKENNVLQNITVKAKYKTTRIKLKQNNGENKLIFHEITRRSALY
jgi:hypothetical protein